ncbi:syntaxin-17 [Metopolophium dirhodum]|uniref:syntaxin-17 n=1 Tax=Metopolophium dirhodum TaxID=44670 RepID=UPI00299006C5|nr:syntaxin-17 [Metopolophium dirhodum]
MAESSSLWTTKQRIRHLDLPIKNFVENAIPYQVETLKTLKSNLAKQRRLENRSGMRQLQMKASQSIKRARALLREMETLRNQVADVDLQTFDNSMNPSKQSILEAIDMFRNEELNEYKSSAVLEETYKDNTEQLEEAENQKRMFLISIEEEKQKQEKMLAIESDVKNVEKDIQGIQDLFRDLSKLVNEQKEDVEKIDAHVETTHENVIQAEQSLRKAAKLKKMSYPLIGAVVGSCVGGPLGCLAGAKVGVFATVTCFVLGFTGGKVLKDKSNAVEETENTTNDLVNQTLKSHTE